MMYTDENSVNNDSFLPDLDDTKSSQSNNKSLLNRSRNASSNQDSLKKLMEVTKKIVSEFISSLNTQ